MKIILISPHFYFANIGIRTLSAHLKQEGYDAHILFLLRAFNETYNDKVLDEVVELSKDADLIGISLMTNDFDQAIQITRKLKGTLDIPIIWGGIHVTMEPAECLNYADMICIGEGEEALKELVKKIQKKQDFYSTRNIWFKHNGKIVKNQLRPLIQDLDSTPWPDCDFKSHYVLSDGHLLKINQDLLERYTGGSRYLILPTRGCPNSCTYCVNNRLNKLYAKQKIIRKRLNGAIKELLEVKKNLPFITHIRCDDDAFFSCTEEEIQLFCEKYKKNVGLPLRIGGLTPQTVTRKKLSLLVDAGMTETRMGIQTASKKMLKMYNRNCSNQQVENAVRLINEFKDKIKLPVYDIMLDNPWQTDEDLVETLMFLSRLPVPFYSNFFSLTAYPGTELYEKAKREGMVKSVNKDSRLKNFFDCKNTYLNRLFIVLNQYTSSGIGISPKIMFLLTNRKLRQMSLSNHLLDIISRLHKFVYLLTEGVKAMLKGEWYRIFLFSQKKVKNFLLR